MNFLTTPHPKEKKWEAVPVSGQMMRLQAPNLGGVWKKEERLLSLSPDNWRESPLLTAVSLLMGTSLPKRGDARKMSLGPLVRPPNFPQSKRAQAGGSWLPAFNDFSLYSSSLSSGCNS